MSKTLLTIATLVPMTTLAHHGGEHPVSETSALALAVSALVIFGVVAAIKLYRKRQQAG